MPLPTTDAPWPPPALIPALDHWRTCDAWWSGDPDALRRTYEGDRHRTRPAQYAGGIVGAAARMWWGRPTPANEPDTKLHVPLPGDLTVAYGALLFGEPIKVTSDDDATSKRLDDLLDEGMQARLLEAAETVAALGGAWLRPMHDPEVADRPWLDVIAPDAGQPEWRGGRVHAVNLWSIVQSTDRLIWRHIERHERGRIVHALYCGTDDKIGRPVPLEDADATAHLAGQVDADGAIDTEHDGLSIVYVPRARPNRAWRTMPALAPMGRSIFDGCESLFDALDEAYSALMRDVRLGKGRIIVGDDMLDDLGRGKGAAYDPDREVFYRSASMAKDTPITHVQFGIRVAEFRDVADEITNVILRHAGLNGSTLGEPGGEGPAMTAREVLTRERRSMLTRETSIRYWAPELRDVLSALLSLDRRAEFAPDVNPAAPITVQFPDTVTEDPTTLAGLAESLLRAQAGSARTRIEVVNPGRDETWIDGEEARVIDEFGISAEPPIDAPFPGDQGDSLDTELDVGSETTDIEQVV